jgi:hypothetical protein
MWVDMETNRRAIDDALLINYYYLTHAFITHSYSLTGMERRKGNGEEEQENRS